MSGCKASGSFARRRRYFLPLPVLLAAVAGALAAAGAGFPAASFPAAASAAASGGGGGGAGGGFLASATFLRLARPSSKSFPTIPSIGLTTENALPMKLCLPSIAHVTLVVVGLSGLSVNEMSAVDGNGSIISSFCVTFSPGLVAVMLIFPLPTSLFPSQA